ncbi:MAG: N-acetylmuramoyl-L-alanine amidase [Beijerinckiaceae bacterium]|nr:N-acetylmuramoyl-L-alanine amidase [Beijerinckiaceae bacterium]
MKSDCSLPAELIPSPNHGVRKGGRIPDSILLHYTGLPNGEAALRQLCDPAAEVSSHYLIWEDGRLSQLVPEARRAWHAGRGSWAGESDMNDVSIGIEIDNAGHRGGLPDYTPDQIETVIALCHDIIARWQIRPERVLAHSDVSHGRKIDPGENFPWAQLAKAGIGHFVAPEAIASGPRLEPGSQGQGVLELQAMLAGYGYGVAMTGIYDDKTESAITAFQRHHRQSLVDGIADHSTIATLRRLIDSLAGR